MEDVREVRHFDGATFPVSAERVSAWF